MVKGKKLLYTFYIDFTPLSKYLHHAEVDGIPYDGSIVNMGVKDENGNVCYIIGLLKAIRKQLKKGDGDSVHVVIRER